MYVSLSSRFPVKMAFLIPINDMDESLFKCAICLNQLREPKLLPCLHRCCTDCSQSKLGGPNESFQCPKCNQKFNIPSDGLKGLKTDSHMKSLLYFIDLKSKFESEEEIECAGCSKKMKRMAYCFKCSDYLCEDCGQFHRKSRILEEHWEFVVNLKDVGLSEMMEKGMACISKAPKCPIHNDKVSDACCVTCKNIPLCIACVTTGKHSGHNIYNVSDFAQMERTKFKEEVKNLEEVRNKVCSLSLKIKTVGKQLTSNASARRSILQTQYDEEDGKWTKLLKDHEDAIKIREKGDVARLEKQLVKEMEALKVKYNKLIQERKAITKEELQVKNSKGMEISKELDILRNELHYLQQSIDQQTEQNAEELKEISDLTEQSVIMCDNLRSTASVILATHDKWSDASCMPYLRKAYKSLIDGARMEFPELESLSLIEKRDLPPLNSDKVRIPEEEDLVVNIEGSKNAAWWITGLASGRDGRIFITSESADRHAATIIYRFHNGELQHYPPKEVLRLSLHKANTAFSHSSVIFPFGEKEIRIYDDDNRSYTRKKIESIVEEWLPDLSVMGAVLDYANNQILVYTNSRDTFVLDNKLTFLYKFTLPEVISWPRNIAIRNSKLLVCDFARRRAHIVTLYGMDASLQIEITKPDFEEGDWGPLSVCMDKKGFIYMLWEATIRNQSRCNLVQFSQDGRTLLKNKPVESDAQFVAMLDTDEGEKLVVATWTSKRLYVYGLVNTQSILLPFM